MQMLDWFIVAAYLVWIVWDGVRLTKNSTEIEGYFLASRSLPWWAIGLSVMATQLSAITMIGTTGQAYDDGMRFLQFYYALPIAMILVSSCCAVLPHRAHLHRVRVPREALRRQDAVVHRLLFLLSRGMSCGVVISAPAVVISVVFGWNLSVTCSPSACRPPSTPCSAACRPSRGPTSSRWC